MSWSKILIVYAIAALLAGYLYVKSEPRSQATTEQSDALAPLLQADPASIDSLKLVGLGMTLYLERRGGRWQVVQALGEGGDLGEGGAAHVSSDLVDALIESFTDLSPIEVVSHAESSQGEFGLEQPAIVISMVAGAKPLATIEVGDRSPTATAVYARRRGDGKIYLVGLNARYYVELLRNEVLRKKTGTD